MWPPGRERMKQSSMEQLEANFIYHRAEIFQQRCTWASQFPGIHERSEDGGLWPPSLPEEMKPAVSAQTHQTPSTSSRASDESLLTPCCRTCTNKATRISKLESEVRQLYSRLEAVGKDVDSANRRRFAAEEMLHASNLPKLKF